ncbi:MAG: hypothetical protein ACR2QF_11170 [Geminicoccaceae bacterium]
MTYLAVEISLYLACAALIGVCLGWLFWGQSYHRRVAKLHAEMTTSLAAERNLSDEVRHELKNAQARLDSALKSEKANAAKTVVEIQERLEHEREAARIARAETEQLRLDMEAAINAEKTSASNAIQEAMQHAESVKASVGDAKIRETQIQAELEELRLTAGAEKFAAQSARAEADQLRREMHASLDAERETSRAARQALDDIRGTLARTFGEGAEIIAALNPKAETPVDEAAAISDDEVSETEAFGDDDQAEAVLEFDDEIDLPESAESQMYSGIEVEPGTAFDVRKKQATGGDEPEHVDDLIVPHDTNIEYELADPATAEHEYRKPTDSDDSATSQFNQLDPEITFNAQPVDQEERTRPSSFYEMRPDDVDSLQEIGGIDLDTEKLLNQSGCYQFKQLAHFSADDIDWLSQALPSMPDLKERIRRDGWIEQARELQVKKYMAANSDRPKWWSRRRLQ